MPIDDGQEMPGTSPGAGAQTPETAATPPSDTARWRERAMELEAQLSDAQQKLGEAQKAVEQAREALDSSERKRQIERQLTEADAMDMETALLLTEASVAQMKQPDVNAAVSELRRRKPWLFRARQAAAASSALGMHAPADPAHDAAKEAAATGDRRALLRYLRARRGG